VRELNSLIFLFSASTSLMVSGLSIIASVLEVYARLALGVGFVLASIHLTILGMKRLSREVMPLLRSSLRDGDQN